MDVGEAGGDAEGGGGLMDGAFEDDVETEDAGHDGRRNGESLIPRDGGRRDHAKAAGAGEFGDDEFVQGGRKGGRNAGVERLEGENGELGHAFAGRQVAGGEVKLPPDEEGEDGEGGGDPGPARFGQGWSGWSGLGAEAVAAAGDGFDVAGRVAFVAEGFAEDGDVAGKADLLDGGIGPDEAEEVGFFNGLAAAFKQDVEGVDGFGHKGDGMPVAEELALHGVVAEGTELVDRRGGHGLIVRLHKPEAGKKLPLIAILLGLCAGSMLQAQHVIDVPAALSCGAALIAFLCCSSSTWRLARRRLPALRRWSMVSG